MLQKQQECRHDKLIFGSGDYYVFCEECGRSWVKRAQGLDIASTDDLGKGDVEPRVRIPIQEDRE